MKRIALMLALVLIAATGCTGWALDSAEQGWSDFEAGDYEDARTNFEDALTWDITYADAYNGLGWCDLLEDKLSDASTNFSSATSYDAFLTDASAGGSLAATELGNHQNAVDYANDVINSNASYQFSHYSSVTIEDIRLAKAKSAAALGDFDTALAEVQAIESGFSADPSTAEGQAAILARIEELITEYGGP
jgi:Flp pilus assembly protein TadD